MQVQGIAQGIAKAEAGLTARLGSCNLKGTRLWSCGDAGSHYNLQGADIQETLWRPRAGCSQRINQLAGECGDAGQQEGTVTAPICEGLRGL